MLKRLDNIGIAVANAERSITFYRDTLGLPATLRGTEGTVDLGGLSLYIFETSTSVAPTGRDADPYSNPVGLDHLAFEVEDIDEAIREYEARGVVFLAAIVGEPGEFRYRGFADPDGNMLYVIQHAHAAG